MARARPPSYNRRYVSSVYFTSITVITIGYGDIHPVNATEQIVVIVMCLLACGIFGYSLNRIGEIIQNIYKKKNAFRKKIF